MSHRAWKKNTPLNITIEFTWGHDDEWNICFCGLKLQKIRDDLLGQNGQIPPFPKFISKKTLFRN